MPGNYDSYTDFLSARSAEERKKKEEEEKKKKRAYRAAKKKDSDFIEGDVLAPVSIVGSN